MLLIKMQKSFLVIFEVFLRLNSDLLDMISCFVTAVNHRIMHVEKGSFSPLIFSTTGGMGPEATRYHKRIAELISVKRGELYSEVVNFIRTKVRVALLKSTLVAIRGERGRRRRTQNTPIEDLSLNLIPERSTYEV